MGWTVVGAQVDVADVCIKEKLQLKTGTSIDSTAYLFEKTIWECLIHFQSFFGVMSQLVSQEKSGPTWLFFRAATWQKPSLPASSIPSRHMLSSMMDRFRADLKDDVERLVNKAPGYGSRLGCHWDDPMVIHSFNASCVLALKLAMFRPYYWIWLKYA